MLKNLKEKYSKNGIDKDYIDTLIKNKLIDSYKSFSNFSINKYFDLVYPNTPPKIKNINFSDETGSEPKQVGYDNVNSIIQKINLNKNNSLILKSTDNTLIINFDNNLTEYNGSYYNSKGSNSATYLILIDKKKLLLKTFKKKFNLDKYQEDLKSFSDVLPNIYYYGEMKVNSVKFYYVIYEYYNTDLIIINKLDINRKILLSFNILNLIKKLEKLPKKINDLKITNISIKTINCELVIIDYDENTFTDKFYPIYEFTPSDNYRINLLSIFYHLFFLGKYDQYKQNTAEFEEKNIDMIKELDSPFDGIKDIIKLLLSDNYSFDEIIELLINVISFPSLSSDFKDEIKEILREKNKDNKLELTKFGLMKKNFINKSFSKLKVYEINDKSRFINFYTKHNDFVVVEYEDKEVEVISNKSLKYALTVVGVIYSIEVTDDGVKVILHINKNYSYKNKGVYDNCRFINNNLLVSLYFWLPNIFDMFHIYFLYGYRCNIYLNIFDHPIVRNDGKFPFEFNFSSKKNFYDVKDVEIFGFSSKTNYKDKLIPYPDIFMFLFKREFCINFNYETFEKNIENKIPKAIFRGTFTSCLEENVEKYDFKKFPRFQAMIKSLQFPEFLDVAIIKGDYNYTNNLLINQDFKKHSFFNNTFLADNKKFVVPNDQSKYRYILNIDGFASAWRLSKELFYCSVIIKNKSEYTDALQQSLFPGINYLEVDTNFENLIKTIEFYNDKSQLSKLQKMVDRNIFFAKNIMTFDFQIEFLKRKIEGGNDTYLSMFAETPHGDTYLSMFLEKKLIPKDEKKIVGNSENVTYYQNNKLVNQIIDYGKLRKSIKKSKSKKMLGQRKKSKSKSKKM